jgi:DNA repair exonuclease SbcCD ATPase subunit
MTSPTDKPPAYKSRSEMKRVEALKASDTPRGAGEFWLIQRPGWTEGFIYNHLDAAQKRLESGIKRPDWADEAKIVHVIEKSYADKLAAELAEANAQLQRHYEVALSAETRAEQAVKERDALRAELDRARAEIEALKDEVLDWKYASRGFP